MWTNRLLKERAKIALKGRYWLAFLVSFLAIMLAAGTFLGGRAPGGKGFGSGVEKSFSMEFSKYESVIRDFFQRADLPLELQKIGIIIMIIIIIGVIIGLLAICFMFAYAIFIGNPVIVGHRKFYIDNRKGKTEAGKLLSSFGSDYKNIVKVMFYKDLRIILWSLLFIVPGIIKAIEYMAVDYLLAEYPKIDLNRALKLSGEITSGQKWNIFKLGLSFFGWFILCIMTGGIGFAFLNPYIQATFAELYVVLIEKSVDDGFEKSIELPEAVPEETEATVTEEITE